MRHYSFMHAIGWLLLMVVMIFAGSGIVMILWNGLLPVLCGFAFVTFWQAVGLLTLGLTMSGALLVMILGIVHGLHSRNHHSRRELMEKWRNMTEEQRREFMASRGFGHFDRTDR